jgi:hypothetical protein
VHTERRNRFLNDIRKSTTGVSGRGGYNDVILGIPTVHPTSFIAPFAGSVAQGTRSWELMLRSGPAGGAGRRRVNADIQDSQGSLGTDLSRCQPLVQFIIPNLASALTVAITENYGFVEFIGLIGIVVQYERTLSRDVKETMCVLRASFGEFAECQSDVLRCR